MTLRNAIIETLSERFSHDSSYLEDKLLDLKGCKNTHQLLYFCMHVDHIGFDMISEKLDFYEFVKFVRDYQALDQGGRFI